MSYRIGMTAFIIRRFFGVSLTLAFVFGIKALAQAAGFYSPLALFLGVSVTAILSASLIQAASQSAAEKAERS